MSRSLRDAYVEFSENAINYATVSVVCGELHPNGICGNITAKMRNDYSSSSAIDLLRLFCVFSIVPLHCRISYNVSIPPCGLVQNVEAWFCSFRGLQVLLFLSGWLFFRAVPSDVRFWSFWSDKLRRRVRSLGIPFLIWCGLAFVYRAVLGKLPDGMNPANPVHIIRYLVGWDGVTSHPGGFGLWYIKTLIIASAMAPLYWSAFRLLGRIGLVLGAFLVVRPPLPIDYPFFSGWFFLGGCVAYQGIDLRQLSAGFGKFLPLSIGLFAVYQLCVGIRGRFPGFLEFAPYALALSIHAVVCDKESQQWLVGLSKSSTWVFFVHFFIAGGIRTALASILHPSTGLAASVAYVLCIVVVLFLSLATFFLLRRLSPKALALATGGRA